MRRTTAWLAILVGLSGPARGQTDDLSLSDIRGWYFNQQAGWSALSLGFLPDAEWRFGRAIAIANREVARDPRLASRSYGDLAWTLHLEGRDAEAEPLARWALIARDRSFGPVSPQAARTAYVLASIELALGRPDDAEGHLTRVLTSAERNSGGVSRATADALDDLATVEASRREFRQARRHFTRSLEIRRVLGETTPGQAIPLDGLAAIDLAEGNLKEAEASLLRARDAASRDGADAGSLARIMTHQAELYRATGRPDEAARAEADARSVESPGPTRSTP